MRVTSAATLPMLLVSGGVLITRATRRAARSIATTELSRSAVTSQAPRKLLGNGGPTVRTVDYRLMAVHFTTARAG